jgi:hypothetical protein
VSDKPAPLTALEVRELDSYGPLSGRASLPARAAELWAREIMWGRQERRVKNGLLAPT